MTIKFENKEAAAKSADGKETAAKPETPAENQPTAAQASSSAETPKDKTETATEKDADKDTAKEKGEKKSWMSWEHALDIVKILATVWVALIGTIASMQFNERQHGLNRIEAIAKILPHLSSSSESAKGTQTPDSEETAPDKISAGGSDMSRDGAMWAVFRIADNKKMLRDLGALFPEDIYRVVSSIAAAEGIEQDPDALKALEVASETLANRYAMKDGYQGLSARLLDQSMRIHNYLDGHKEPLNIVDLNGAGGTSTADQTQSLMATLNKMGEMHLAASKKAKTVSNDRSRARQLFKTARHLGLTAKHKSKEIILEVAKADRNLATILLSDGNSNDADMYMLEAQQLEEKARTGTDLELSAKVMAENFAKLDVDKDGQISVQDIENAHKQGRINDELYEKLKQNFEQISEADLSHPKKSGGLYDPAEPKFVDSNPEITMSDVKAILKKP